MYRLHIDIPMPFNENDARDFSLAIVSMLDKEKITSM